ncbi:MAG: hypothetical protein EHM19_08950 [Candidatus Latescibacterota bacterium]|nr:MAG: hypothetical protein EHM19_08950 [Candidatus Latescibacterota bacterium]
MARTSKSCRGDQGGEMRAEYDFSQGVRGKHAAAYAEGTNVVILDPDIAAAFPTSASVNEALRVLVKIAHRRKAKKPRSPRSA